MGMSSFNFKRRPTAIIVGFSIVTLILYLIGIKFLVLPVLIAISIWRLPLPRVFSSVLSKVIVVFFMTMGLVQISATIQFLILPHTGFDVLTLFLFLLFITIWLFAPKRSKEKSVVISTNDICALIVVIVFLLPFAPILAGQKSIERIGDIGSVQATDGVNHYTWIDNSMVAQHSSYIDGGAYYPSGYEVSVAFMQSTFFRNQYDLGWRNNVWLFFGDFLLYGALLGYVVCLLCISWLGLLKQQLAPDGWGWSKFLVAACAALPLAILYLLPFIPEGFLNYYAVCAALVLGVLVLGEIRSGRGNEGSIDLSEDRMSRWWLILYFVLMYISSMSWPLLIPPFLVTAGLFLIPPHLEWRQFFKRTFNRPAVPVLVLIILQFVPIYFQLKYSSGGSSQGLDTPGGLFQFHGYLLLAGVFLVLSLVLTTKVEESFRRLLINVFFPLFAFIGLLMLFQYFTTGHITYYVIKVTLLAELLLLAIGAAVFVSSFVTSKLCEARYAIFIPFLFLFIVLLLISSVDNPLKDARDLFRTHSHDVIPQYLSQDVKAYVALGEAGKLHHMNMTVLHYNPVQDKFFANMQGPFWAGAMQYDGNGDTFNANCLQAIYNNQAFGDFGTMDQRQLRSDIKKCAAMHRMHGEEYYVVTDSSSAPYVRKFIGQGVVYIVY